MKIVIGVPNTGTITTPCVKSLLTLNPGKFGERIIQFEQGTLLHFQRNNVVKKAMESGAEYLLFIDSDMAIPSDALKKLSSHDKDIVSGLYFSKTPPFIPQIYEKNKGAYKTIIDYEEGLIEVDSVGAGCLLIKTSVFEKIKPPYFSFSDAKGKGNQPLSEDMYFCNKASKAGIKIHCDTTVKCAHVGTQIITENAFKQLKHRIKFKE